VQAAKGLMMSERNVFSAYVGLGRVFAEQNRMDSAVFYFEKAERLARDNGFTELLISVAADLSRTYSDIGNKELAAHYRHRYLELNDSAFNSHGLNRIRDIEIVHEAEKFQKTINVINMEKKMRTHILIIVSVALAIMIGMVIWIGIQNHRLKQKNRALFQRNLEEMKERAVDQNYDPENNQTIAYINTDTKYLISLKENDYSPDELSEIQTIKDEDSKSVMSEDIRSRLKLRITEIMTDENLFCREGFSLRELAELCDSNSKYVSQVINEDIGKTFAQMLNEARVNVARRRFMDFEHYGHMTIEAIISELGFKSRSTFSKTFKRLTGLNPSEFQRLARENQKEK
ncbi:MAG: helix-turn-helix domain-containing protein, partial [Muribaculaceae bacterium]|nr:helix-turn-helix domain-containing protein [Muribaculaceae bacterium]